jgi:hypothetical protein
MTEAELEAMLNRVSEATAKRTAEEMAKRLGLDDDAAPRDLTELRDLMGAWRTARKEIAQTILRVGTTMTLGAIIAAVWFYARSHQGGGP